VNDHASPLFTNGLLLAPSILRHYKRDDMPRTTAKGRIKNKKKYEALKRKGMSKTRAAKIANSGKKGSLKGGKNSHKGKKKS
jgi:hypothetical protein